MGEVVNLPTGRRRKPRLDAANEQAPTSDSARPAASSWIANGFAGIGKFALASTRITAGYVLGTVARLLWLMQRPISFALSMGALGMVIVFAIQAANGWPDPKLAFLSIGSLCAFLAAAGGYDRLVKALFQTAYRLQGS